MSYLNQALEMLSVAPPEHSAWSKCILATVIFRLENPITPTFIEQLRRSGRFNQLAFGATHLSIFKNSLSS